MDEGPWRILVERTQEPLATRATAARTLRERLTGLLGRSRLPEGEALVFPRCRSIHTIGMRFPIDAVFVDRGWRVVALRPEVRPGRLVPPVWSAWGVVETPSGTIAKSRVAMGDQLNVHPPISCSTLWQNTA